MKVALIHDWLTGMRGGEKVLEVFCELFPDASLFTLVHRKGTVSPTIEALRPTTSFLQRLPGGVRHYRYFLPLMPTAVECLDVTGFDLVLSSSHCVAKGIIPGPGARHVSYTHSPMRYIWDLWPRYFGTDSLRGKLMQPTLTRLRAWDVAASARVDHFIANSQFVSGRIERYYRRSSEIIQPPVDVERFDIDSPPGEDYLMVSALVPSKGLELALDTFRELDRPLRIVGVGPLEKELRERAGRRTTFLGWLSEEALRDEYARAKAVVHTAVEDFGIVALEAAAAGRPVIALGQGGSLETVAPLGGDRPPTGILFEEPTVGDLRRAVQTLEAERGQFDPGALKAHAAPFHRDRFRARITAARERELQG